MNEYYYFRAKENTGWITSKNHKVIVIKGQLYKMPKDRMDPEDLKGNAEMCEFLSPSEILVAAEGDMDWVTELK